MLKLKLQDFVHLMQRNDMWKDPDAGKGWRQEEKGMTKDEMVGWYHWLNGPEFEQAPGAPLVMDREAWHPAVRGVTNSWTWLSDFHFTNVI